jgi:hypothetical protein
MTGVQGFGSCTKKQEEEKKVDLALIVVFDFLYDS